jgi:hypothetical protein
MHVEAFTSSCLIPVFNEIISLLSVQVAVVTATTVELKLYQRTEQQDHPSLPQEGW